MTWYKFGRLLALIVVIELVLLTNQFVDNQIKNYQRNKACLELIELMDCELGE
jgi:hypothetical protein